MAVREDQKSMNHDDSMDMSETNKRGQSPNKWEQNQRRSASRAKGEGEGGASGSDFQTKLEHESTQNPFVQRGKGAKSGKGVDRPQRTVDNSSEGILFTHSKLLAQIGADRRDEARRYNWILEIQAGSQLAKVLAERDSAWIQKVKGLGKGERMEKQKHEVLFETLLEYLHAMLGEKEKADQGKKETRYMRRWMELAYSEEADEGAKGAIQFFRKLGRAGRSSEDETTRYIMRIRQDAQRYRECHDDLQSTYKDFNRYCNVTFKKDYGPKTQADKDLDGHLMHLNSRRNG